MIVTLTMHPTIDENTTVDKIIPEAKLRCTEVIHEAGGGGINVAKALKKLGEDPLAIFPAGGHNGNMLKHLMEKEKIRYKAVNVPEETRESFIVLETSTNKQYRFNTPGGEMSKSCIDHCLELIKNLEEKPDYIVASGSLPPGIDADFYGRVAKLAHASGAKFIVDTSGEALQHAVNEGVYLLKPNLSELSKLLGVERIDPKNVEKEARKILDKGNCEIIVVSMGEDGATLVTKDFQERINTPKVEKKTTVGAGDSMVAGMVYMLAQNKSLGEVLRFGVACGTAATMNEGTALFDVDDVYKLYEGLTQRK